MQVPRTRTCFAIMAASDLLTTTQFAMAAKAAGAPLELITFTPPALEAHDVFVDVKYCGMCHSDLHCIDNDWMVRAPHRALLQRPRILCPRARARAHARAPYLPSSAARHVACRAPRTHWSRVTRWWVL
ncbi:hypothetical protein EON67_12465, partial [archaeon]